MKDPTCWVALQTFTPCWCSTLGEMTVVFFMSCALTWSARCAAVLPRCSIAWQGRLKIVDAAVVSRASASDPGTAYHTLGAPLW